MVKGSKPRHSRTTRKPVTIDLEPDAVSAAKPAEKKTAKATAKAPSTTAAARATGPVTGKPVAARKDEDKSSGPANPQTKQDGPKDAKSPSGGAADTQTKSAGDKPDATSSRATETVEAKKTGSGLKSFGIGLIAAIVAAALVVGLQWGGVLPVPATGSSGSNVLTEDVNALKQSVAALESEAETASGDVGQALESRINALESAVGSSAGSGDVEKRFADLENKVTALSSQTGDAVGSSNAPALAGINDKLATLEKTQSAQQTTLQSAEGAISDLGKKIAADEASQDQTIKTLEDRLSAIEKTLEAPRQDIKVARALAAASLKAAIDRGGSFMAELEAFASVDGNSPVLEQLRTLAASGVPSRAELLTRFPAAANAMIDAGNESDASEGLIDHLLNSATSLVKVRPVGDVSGDSVEAIVARMETRLKNGNLQGAVDEWNTLPQTSKDASQAYTKDLEARIEAEKLVSGALTAALPSGTSSGAQTAAPAVEEKAADEPQTGEQN